MDVPLAIPFGSSLLATTLTMGRVAAGAVEAALPVGDDRLAWRELGNKLEAFRWFQQGRTGTPGTDGPDDPFPWLWRTEGAGYRWAEGHGPGAGAAPRLSAESPGAPGTLLPLHTGYGVALATRIFAAGVPERPCSLGPVLERFAAAARDAAAPGWDGAVLEASGLVVRTLHPHRLLAVGRWLEDRGDELRSLFWHGVGRGLYFAPTQVVPWGVLGGRALDKARREPPGEAERDQAVAGLVWALTLVNLRSPEVLAAFLARHGDELAPRGPFEHGVAAAVLGWSAAAGRDATLERFLGHAPARAEEAEAWRLRVRAPCRWALAELAPAFDAGGRWGELFRYRPLERLQAELGASPGGRG